MSLQGPPDSWIESMANGAPCDDAGYCEVCDEHLDSGRCPGHCENETCEHVAHCDVCGLGLTYEADNVCEVCFLKWKAQHQLMWPNDLPALPVCRIREPGETLMPDIHGIEMVLADFNRRFAR